MRKGGLLLAAAFFSLLVPSLLPAASIPCQWTGVEKIIAVGDIHGDYENFVKILKGTGVVDEALHWQAGKAHFVQVGDILDRGPDARKIFDLLKELEKEAERVGGKVHVLLGNHEEMNITGVAFRYPDYVTVDQFISFLPPTYRERKEKELRKIIMAAQSRANNDQPERLISQFWDELRRDSSAQRQYLSNFRRTYGSWLLQKNAVIKINGIVFVHGGISEKFSKWKIDDINQQLRLELSDLARADEMRQLPNISRPQVVYREDGPLWYRELASVPEEDMAEEVDRILANLGAEHMVIAHTPRIAATLESMRRFGGKVWVIDTGISRAYGGPLRALIIEGGEFFIWGEDHETPEKTFENAHASHLNCRCFLLGKWAGFEIGRWTIEGAGRAGDFSSSGAGCRSRQESGRRPNSTLDHYP